MSWGEGAGENVSIVRVCHLVAEVRGDGRQMVKHDVWVGTVASEGVK